LFRFVLFCVRSASGLRRREHAGITPGDSACHAACQSAPFAVVGFAALVFRFRPFGSTSSCEGTEQAFTRRKQHMKTKNEQTEQKTSAAPAYTNRVTLVGFIADKADQYNGCAVLRLATQASWKDKTSGKWESHTDWHRIVAWNGLADAVKEFGKGDHVMVEGELRTSRYAREFDTEDGRILTVMMNGFEIRARAIRKLDRKPKAEQPKGEDKPKAKKKAA
jgi:single-strand DNA-binding protein